MAYVVLSNTGGWSIDMLGVVGTTFNGDLRAFISGREDIMEEEIAERYHVFDNEYDRQMFLNELEMDVIAEGTVVLIMATKETDDMPDVYVMIEV